MSTGRMQNHVYVWGGPRLWVSLKCSDGGGKGGCGGREGSQCDVARAFCMPPGLLMTEVKQQAETRLAPEAPSGRLPTQEAARRGLRALVKCVPVMPLTARALGWRW